MDSIIITNLVPEIDYVNPAFFRHTGYTSDEVIGRNPRLLQSGSTPPETFEAMWAALHRGESWRGELYNRRKDGSTFIDDSVITPLRQGNAVTHYVGVQEDITERKRAAAEILAEKAKLEGALSSMSDAVFISDADGNFIHVNEGFATFHRFRSKQECLMELSDYPAILEVSTPEGEVLPLRRWAVPRALRGESATRAEFNLRRRDTGETWSGSYAFGPIRDNAGDIVGSVVVGRDVTDAKRRTALLALLEALARATNEAATPEAGMQACLALICDYGHWPVGHVGLYAPGQTAGVTPVSIWRCNDRERYSEFMRESDHFPRSGPGGSFLGAAARERRPVWLEDVSGVGGVGGFGPLAIAKRIGVRAGFVFPVFVGGEIAGFLEFFDTVERKRDRALLAAIDGVASQLARLIERSRINANLEMRVASRTAELEAANRELNAFSHTIAHDLRAPMRAIGGFSSIVLAENSNKLDKTTLDYLKRIVTGAERMNRLIDDLLNLSRLSRMKMKRQNIDLSAMATAVVHALIEAHPHRRVAVRIQPGLACNGDPGLMRAALGNLIGNARKYTFKLDAAEIEMGTCEHEGRTAYYIRDNGAGFDMQYAKKLFTPFQRMHHRDEFEGTGIGLATVKRIIERHGGEIRIESAVNAGTTVFFTLGEQS
jgi:PAS domain S-box-containing protein